jgi:hypothetical protein
MEIVRLRDQLRVEQSEKAELQQQLEQFASSQAQVPTSISFFAPPPDMKLLQQLDTIKKTIAGLKESWSAQERSGIDEIVKELPLLRVSSAPLPTTSPTEGHMTHCFNPITTKVIHLTSPPPLPPQVAVSHLHLLTLFLTSWAFQQFYSSSKSNDTAIEELQEQLNDSRKEAKRTAEVFHFPYGLAPGLTRCRLLRGSAKSSGHYAASCSAGAWMCWILRRRTRSGAECIPCLTKRTTYRLSLSAETVIWFLHASWRPSKAKW